MHTIETRVFIALMIGAGILGLVLAFFMVTIVKHQKRKIATEKEKLVEEIRLLETERGRIAADLHDELGSLISAIKINFECLHTNDPEDLRILERTGGYIDTTMQKIREISNNLMPKTLQQHGLLAAIKEFTEMIGHGDSLKMEYECYTKQLDMGTDKEIHVYRIIQEIVNNTIKHADARKIAISLSTLKNKLHLKISDNGKGFDKEMAAKKQGSSGLRNIVRRVEMVGGKVYLDSSPGNGTIYSIEIPI